MIIRVQDTSEKLGVTAWIYTRPGSSHFVLESSDSFPRIENETKRLPHPSFGEVSSASFRQQLNICHTPSFAGFLQPHFDGLKIKLNICHTPSKFGEVSSASFLNVCTPCEISSALFQQVEDETKHLPRPL